MSKFVSKNYLSYYKTQFIKLRELKNLIVLSNLLIINIIFLSLLFKREN